MTEVRERTWLERGRISPRDVLTAYERTGWTPARGFFVLSSDGKTEACGIGVVVGQERSLAEPAKTIYQHLYGLGFSASYMSGFISGFDGNEDGASCNHLFGRGWRDGRRAARHVFGESA